MNRITERVMLWWRAFRFHYIPPSYLPAILGGVLAWELTGKFDFFLFALTVLAVTFNHAALNMTDDYFDYIHSVDQAKDRESNPYSGGSGTLTGGLITTAQMRTAFIVFYALTAVTGIYLTIARGWPVLAFGLFGMASSYFYTAPPVRYGYHGFGEVSQLVNFSLIIGLGSFYVQAQELSWQAAFVLLPLGFMMFAMITINEIPDERQDRAGGKRNLVVIFGPQTAVKLYGLSMSAAYALLLIAPITGAAHFTVYIALLTLPLFLKAFGILRKNYRDPLLLSPANMLTIRTHNLTGLLLSLAVLIDIASAQDGSALRTLPVLLLAGILYAPVAFAVFIRAPRSAGT